MRRSNATRSSLDLLYRISRELTAMIDLPEVLGRVLTLSSENLGAERGSLVVLDEDQQPVQAAILYEGRLIPNTLRELRGTLGQGLAGWVLRTRQPALVRDTSQDDRWLRLADDAVERSGAKSAMCVPLLARDQLVGILTIVHPKPGVFTEDHLALLTAIADQAGIAVNNARLYTSLQEARQRYQELFEDSIDPILLSDPQGHIVDINRQAATSSGYSRQQLLAMRISDLHTPDWNRLGSEFELIEAGTICSYEASLKCHDGSQLPVEVYVRQVCFEDCVWLQWMLRDIRERKDLDALRNDMIAMIYHDLRSPLSNIISSLDMLKLMLPDEEFQPVQPLFTIASRSSARLQRLINSLLDINRLEAGQPITNQQVTAVAGLAREAIEAVQPQADSKQIGLAVDLGVPFPEVCVDADMIRRVLINLLENACKFTPIGGRIIVGARSEGERVALWVQDNGPGIPPEARDTIFDKFVRLPGDKTSKGLGLGLAFCRLAVQAHGGRIWVEPSPEGGSRFHIVLPAANTANLSTFEE